MKKILSIGILLFVLIAFSGIASATTYSDSGSKVKYTEGPGHCLFKKDIFNWHIVTSTSRTSSIVVINWQSQYWDHKWINVPSRNFKYTINYIKVNKNTIRIVGKTYNKGTLVGSWNKYRTTQTSPYYQAKTHKTGLVGEVINYHT